VHPEKSAAKWAAYSPGYKQRRAELDAGRRQDPGFREKAREAVQEYKTRPENTERVRAYNRAGRQRYMARADRPCLFPAGCADHAGVGLKYCPEHHRAEANRRYRSAAARQREAMAERQQRLCPLCLDYLPPSLSRTHVDHVIPRASGLVIEEEWNLQLTHARCNLAKSDRITQQALRLAAEHDLILLTARPATG
jgi:5-methylcytosine-specific restriction endonuclease McrA